MSRVGRAAWHAVAAMEADQQIGYSAFRQRVIDELRAALDADERQRAEEWEAAFQAACREVRGNLSGRQAMLARHERTVGT